MSIHKLCISLPYLVNQIFPFQYFSSVFTQHSKELLFCLTKFNRFSIFEKFHFIEIELKSIKLHRIFSCCLFISKLHRHSCTQNHQTKRFRNIIISNDNNYEQDQVNLQYTLFITRTSFEGNKILQHINENDGKDATGSNHRERFFGMVGAPISGYNGNLDSFIGPYRTYSNPIAVEQGKCTGEMN